MIVNVAQVLINIGQFDRIEGEEDYVIPVESTPAMQTEFATIVQNAQAEVLQVMLRHLPQSPAL